MATKVVCLALICLATVAQASVAVDDDEHTGSLTSLLSAFLPADDEAPIATDEESSPPAKCCLPSVWQGRLVSQYGFAGSMKKKKKHQKKKHRGPVATRSIDQVYVDGKNQRVAGDKLSFRGHRPLNISYIMLVRANKSADLYVFSRSAKKCRHRTLRNVVWRPQCLPANATMRGTYSLGPSSGGLSVQSWTFHVFGGRRMQQIGERPHPRPRLAMFANFLLVPKTCVPVVLQEVGSVSVRRGEDGMEYSDDDEDADESDLFERTKPKPKPRPRGMAFVGSVYYTGVQPRITDPKVFNPPSYCKKTGDNTLLFEDGESDDIPSVLERFVDL